MSGVDELAAIVEAQADEISALQHGAMTLEAAKISAENDAIRAEHERDEARKVVAEMLAWWPLAEAVLEEQPMIAEWRARAGLGSISKPGVDVMNGEWAIHEDDLWRQQQQESDARRPTCGDCGHGAHSETPLECSWCPEGYCQSPLYEREEGQ